MLRRGLSKETFGAVAKLSVARTHSFRQTDLGFLAFVDAASLCSCCGLIAGLRLKSQKPKLPVGRLDDNQLAADKFEPRLQYGRYGYRRISGLLRDSGWHANYKRVENVWRQEALKVPMMQPMIGRLRLIGRSRVPIMSKRNLAS